MSEPTLNFLTPQILREYAGDRSFDLGRQYFKSGSVRDLEEYDGKVSAKVSGTSNYKVKLWEESEEDGDLGYDCSCPYAAEGNFCKHCVAAGLAWIAGDKAQTNTTSGDKNSPPTLDEIKSYLQTQEKSELIELLMCEVRDNHALRQQLMLGVARRNPEGLDVSIYLDALDRVFEIDEDDYDEYGEYLSTLGNAGEIDQTVESIRDLLDDGHYQEVIDLCEHGLRTISEIRDSVEVLTDIEYAGKNLGEIHLAACEKAKPDPEELAKRLFGLELEHILFGTVHHYAGILGEKGLDFYRRLVEKEWFKFPPLKAGDASPYNGRRARLEALMKDLSRGDTENIVEIESRNLAAQPRYLKIAEIYRDEEKYDQALEWAERGARDFPGEILDWRLGVFLADEYHRRGRHDEEMKIIWDQFKERADFSNYGKLRAHADRIKPESGWKIWREKALALIRQKISASKIKPANSWSHRPEDSSLLVQIFLHENLPEEAWQEAVDGGGCSNELWLELARVREQTHPADSLKIYRDRVEPKIKETNNQAYEQAVTWLKGAQRTMFALNRETEFYKYLAGLRTTYKAKRNFVKLLDTTKW